MVRAAAALVALGLAADPEAVDEPEPAPVPEPEAVGVEEAEELVVVAVAAFKVVSICGHAIAIALSAEVEWNSIRVILERRGAVVGSAGTGVVERLLYSVSLATIENSKVGKGRTTYTIARVEVGRASAESTTLSMLCSTPGVCAEMALELKFVVIICAVVVTIREVKVTATVMRERIFDSGGSIESDGMKWRSGTAEVDDGEMNGIEQLEIRWKRCLGGERDEMGYLKQLKKVALGARMVENRLARR
ncbi:hypothetical protein MMC11_002656 [Xylographa trunciseda]|nr:hypothetical protein [Xylographa trunciseda]